MRAICRACESGDHSNHIPAFADICIGCACEVTPNRNEVTR